MDKYITGAVIRKLREDKKMTQEELAEKIFVTGKAVSKWETGQGFPDISLLEPLANALGISVIELLQGKDIRNKNQSSNMLKCKFHICPICGNVIHSIGDALVSCCGIALPPLNAEVADKEHLIKAEIIENEYFVTVNHPMEKGHYISFLCAVSDLGIQFVKLYPEGSAEAQFRLSRVKKLYAYCNRHGLFAVAL